MPGLLVEHAAIVEIYLRRGDSDAQRGDRATCLHLRIERRIDRMAVQVIVDALKIECAPDADIAPAGGQRQPVGQAIIGLEIG